MLKIYCILIYLVCFFCHPFFSLKAELKGLNNQIHFDVQGDGVYEMSLQTTGLGIGTVTPQANLHCMGNAIVDKCAVGSNDSPQHSLQVNGSIAYSYATLTTGNSILSTHSHVFADTAQGNITVFLPLPSSVVGRIYSIKKTSPSHYLWVSCSGNIDGASLLSFGPSTGQAPLPYINLFSGNSEWNILSQSGSTRPIMTHRYVFNSNANDTVGSLHGTATTAGTNTEAPSYTAATPTGSTGPTMALSVGANVGTLKSGVIINKSALASSGTMSFWFKPRTSANGRYLLNTGLNNGFVLLQHNNTSVVLQAVKTDNPTNNVSTYTGALTDWHFAAFSWRKDLGSGIGIATTYLDNQSFTLSFSSANLTLPLFYLGAWNLTDDPNNITNQFDGLIYDVQIYDTMVSASDINYLKNNPGSVLP